MAMRTGGAGGAPSYTTKSGKAWRAKGDIDKAIADYEKALELKPDYVCPPTMTLPGCSRLVSTLVIETASVHLNGRTTF